MSGVPYRSLIAAVVLGLLATGCVTTTSPQQAGLSRASSSAPKTPRAALCVGTRESTRHQREVAQANARRVYFSKKAASRRVARRKAISRFIAVQTVRNTDSTGEATCMIFDRESGNLVNTLVYDCDRIPQVGEAVKFVTFNTTYVGG